MIEAGVALALAVWLLGRPGVPVQPPAPLMAGAGLLLVLVGPGRGWLVPLVTAGVLGGALLAVTRRRRQRAACRAAEASLLEACELLAADLRAGLTPEVALARASSDWPLLAEAAAAARFGTDVPATLRQLATNPGCADLRLVAAAWHVAQRSGSALASGMTRTAATLRQARASRATVRSELSSARATARLLAVLPAFSWLLGSGMGGDPMRFLFGGGWGWGCLVVGLGFDLVGLWWIDRIAHSIEKSA